MYRKSYIIYYDRKQHFFNDEFRKNFRNEKIQITYNSSKSFKNINIIEISNKLLKLILKKNRILNRKKRNQRISKSAEFLNFYIIKHFDLTFINILFEPLQKTFAFVIILFILSKKNVYE